MKYGRAEDEWVVLTTVATEYLVDVGRRKTETTYDALNQHVAEQAESAPFDFSSAADCHAMRHLLFRVVDETHHEGFMLSALLSYGDSADVGSGFFSLAQDLNLLSRRASDDERTDFRESQVSEIFTFYDIHSADSRLQAPPWPGT